jgi:hypothetical protein
MPPGAGGWFAVPVGAAAPRHRQDGDGDCGEPEPWSVSANFQDGTNPTTVQRIGNTRSSS